MSALDAVPSAVSGSAVPDEASLWSRLSDRLNPILVREVQQAVKGRVFPLMVMLALGICVVIAIWSAADYADGATGLGAFDAGLATLVPLVLFIIPMQAYNSMRTELKGGIVEQLLLSRLSPGAVLSGKLQAAMVQFVLYVSVLSPLLATSYLLRGVDLPTIAISLMFAFVICISATAFAVSSAAQAIVPALQPIANLGIAFGLGVGTVSMIGFVGSGGYSKSVGWLVRSDAFGMYVSGIVVLATVSTTMSWLAARTFLLHTFENKSTGFRIFMFSLPVLAYGWMLLFVDSTAWSRMFPILTFALLVAGMIFGVFMITEQKKLSPRVWAHVPANRSLARLMTPLLPGRDRGLVCFLIYASLLMVLAYLFWPTSRAGFLSGASRYLSNAGLMALTYGVIYLSIGRWVRDRLPDTLQGNHAGRFLLPVLAFLFCVVPLLIDVIARGHLDSWHVGHIMNPVWTIREFVGGTRWDEAWPIVWMVLVGVTLLQIPVLLRAFREVWQASGARRMRMQGAASDADADADADANI
ncbi:MAG: hypothetical protein ACI89X_001495 [Planctomycetota bacterium]|jgi:hypothetical protein